MNIISLMYFIEVAKDLHITKTANRLYISQQTLSNHIQRLEEYYGTKLLYRKPSLSLTYAGEKVLEFAKVVVKEETNLKDILADIDGQTRGTLRIGANIARSTICLPIVLDQFSLKYPEFEVRIVSGISSELEPMVENGDLDFAIVLGDQPNPKLIGKLLLRDQIYLCVTDTLLYRVYGEKAAEIKQRSADGAHIEDFASLPFSMMSNRMGDQVWNCFEAAGIHPKVVLSTSNSTLFIPSCCNSLSACFVNQMSLVSVLDKLPQDMNIFPLLSREQPLQPELALIRHKDRYLSKPTLYFIDLLLQFFEELDRINPARMA